MARKEKNFQTEIKRAFDFWKRRNQKSGFYFKIPDVGFRNPFDCLIIANNKTLALELKINKAKNTFNFKNFFLGREHEKAYLKLVETGGGTGWVLINHFNLKPRVNKAYAFRIDDILHLQTIKLENIPKISIEIKKIQGEWEKYWDLTPLL